MSLGGKKGPSRRLRSQHSKDCNRVVWWNWPQRSLVSQILSTMQLRFRLGALKPSTMLSRCRSGAPKPSTMLSRFCLGAMKPSTLVFADVELGV